MAVDLTQPIPAAADWFTGMIDQAKIQQNITDNLEALRQGQADSGWIPLTITGSWAVVTGNPLNLSAVGPLRLISGSLQRTATTIAPSTAWSINPCATLPAGHRPSGGPLLYTVPGTTLGSNLQIRITNDGQINVRNVGTAALAVGDYMDINVPYRIG